VHGVGGITGSILTGVFAAESLGGLGLGEVTIAHQVGVQALAVVATIIWTVAFTYIILKVLDAMMGLRVSEDQEVEGLDIVMHEETGYHNI
jgi:Amt family ammonium transporter